MVSASSSAASPFLLKQSVSRRVGRAVIRSLDSLLARTFLSISLKNQLSLQAGSGNQTLRIYQPNWPLRCCSQAPTATTFIASSAFRFRYHGHACCPTSEPSPSPHLPPPWQQRAHLCTLKPVVHQHHHALVVFGADHAAGGLHHLAQAGVQVGAGVALAGAHHLVQRTLHGVVHRVHLRLSLIHI